MSKRLMLNVSIATNIERSVGFGTGRENTKTPHRNRGINQSFRLE